jgi:AICAR transformylase/IMP cyclohydrolase PurH
LAIIQPLGSKNDKKIIDFAKQNKIPLYFTKNRVFKH